MNERIGFPAVLYVVLALVSGRLPSAAAGESFEELLRAADALAAQARAAPEEHRVEAARRALEAYARLIERKGKDPKLHPRLRRRRASLLKRLGRPADAFREYEAIVKGRARRKDRAGALCEMARIEEGRGELERAQRLLGRAVEDFPDVIPVRARASFERGGLLERLGRLEEAERCYRYVVEKCRDEVKAVIRSYDALALLALRSGDRTRAWRWLRECRRRFEKRALRRDRFGRYVSRLLGEMRAPAALAQSTAPVSPPASREPARPPAPPPGPPRGAPPGDDAVRASSSPLLSLDLSCTSDLSRPDG